MSIMKSSDDVKPTFVSMVVGRGVLNGVVNITFATLNFSPSAEEGSAEVYPDPVISARLRMDVPCARQLRESLDTLLKAIDEFKPPKPAETNGAGVAAPTEAPAPEKLN